MKKLWTKIVLWRYRELGLRYGEMISYVPIGIPIGLRKIEKKFEFWERRYYDLGYKLLELDDFVTAGGYVGREHLIGKFNIKREE